MQMTITSWAYVELPTINSDVLFYEKEIKDGPAAAGGNYCVPSVLVVGHGVNERRRSRRQTRGAAHVRALGSRPAVDGAESVQPIQHRISQHRAAPDGAGRRLEHHRLLAMAHAGQQLLLPAAVDKFGLRLEGETAHPAGQRRRLGQRLDAAAAAGLLMKEKGLLHRLEETKNAADFPLGLGRRWFGRFIVQHGWTGDHRQTVVILLGRILRFYFYGVQPRR